MPKRLLSAIEIRDEINRRISVDERLDAEGRQSHVPLPTQTLEPGYYGANWICQNFTGNPAYHSDLERIIRTVMDEYDCDWD